MHFLLELAAVSLALLYVVLAIYEHRSCWIAAALSAGLYLWIFSQALLYMEAALQGFYIIMAGYGWVAWGQDQSRDTLPIRRWQLNQHLRLFALIITVSGLFGYMLAHHTQAALPWLDSFTTVSALVATWLVARKILENWLYWILIDLVSIYLYLSRDLYMTAGLFAGYVILAVVGYIAWRRHYERALVPAPQPL